MRHEPGEIAVPRRRRSAVALGALAVLVVVVSAAVVPAAWAVDRQEIVAPAADATVKGPVGVVARITPGEGEIIQGVTARLTGDVERSTALRRGEAAGEWRGSIDPTTRPALANGVYRLSVQATPVLGDPAEPTTRQVRLAVPPPERALTAEPDDQDATRVVMEWDPVALPDFVAYRVQRRSHADDGRWATVGESTDPRAVGLVDTVDQPGAYRYRLIVVRGDGLGGELFATSAARGVTADPNDPGTFTPPAEPAPRPANTPAPSQPPDPDGGPITRPEGPPPAADGSPGNDTPTPSPTTPETQTAEAPPAQDPQVRPPALDDEEETTAPPRPAIVPADDGVFDELLPFEATESEMEITESETAFLDGSVRGGGALAVYTEEAEGPEGVLTAVAGGLLLLVVSAHVRRFLAGGDR